MLFRFLLQGQNIDLEQTGDEDEDATWSATAAVGDENLGRRQQLETAAAWTRTRSVGGGLGDEPQLLLHYGAAC